MMVLLSKKDDEPGVRRQSQKGWVAVCHCFGIASLVLPSTKPQRMVGKFQRHQWKRWLADRGGKTKPATAFMVLNLMVLKLL
jgi:hypothetical protein